MNTLLIITYFTLFSILAGASFAVMWSNIKSINEMKSPIFRHPEAPEPGEVVMYVDVSNDTSTEFEERKKQLEALYND